MTKLYWSTKQKKWVDTPQHIPEGKPSGLYVQSDWEPVESPITGEVFGGRRAYLDHIREHQGHIKERGETKAPPKPDRQAIRSAVKESLRELGVTGG